MNAASLRIREALEVDLQSAARLINSAFAIETFLEGPLTTEQQLRERMRKGTFLLGEDANGSDHRNS